MAKRISDTQIELLKNCWHEGKSLPHCAMVASVSKSTAKKYLANEIRTYIAQNAISELNLNQFRQYIEQSFAETGNDQLALKDLYYELQNEHKADYDRLIAIRECYDNALSKLTNKEKSSPLLEANKVASIKKTIKAYASRYQCKIPGRIKSVLEQWNELQLLQHLVYHIARNKFKTKHTDIMALLDSLETEALCQDWLDEVLKQ